MTSKTSICGSAAGETGPARRPAKRRNAGHDGNLADPIPAPLAHRGTRGRLGRAGLTRVSRIRGRLAGVCGAVKIPRGIEGLKFKRRSSTY
jgi:hypothetical protein